MLEHKAIKNYADWLPMDKRKDRFGLPMPPRKLEKRKPLLWLAGNEKNKGGDLYLVNATGETLELVRSVMGGFATADEVVVPVARTAAYEYANVENNDAVKIETFDGNIDLDFVLQVIIHITSPKLGAIEVKTPAQKGGVGECVLLWDTGEAGKHVGIRKQEIKQ